MNTILDVKDLVISFENDGQMVEAVRNISFNIPAGQTVALVGESGSGNQCQRYLLLACFQHLHM